MILHAHSTPQGEETWQELSAHVENVAALASLFAADFGASEWAAAAGLLHDRGKATAGYQKRLRGGARVDHSTLGAQWTYQKLRQAGSSLLVLPVTMADWEMAIQPMVNTQPQD